MRAPPRVRGGLVARNRVRNLHSGAAPCFVHVPGVHESLRHEMMFRADARAAMRCTACRPDPALILALTLTQTTNPNLVPNHNQGLRCDHRRAGADR